MYAFLWVQYFVHWLRKSQKRIHCQFFLNFEWNLFSVMNLPLYVSSSFITFQSWGSCVSDWFVPRKRQERCFETPVHLRLALFGPRTAYVSDAVFSA